jgi:hypothetical protein
MLQKNKNTGIDENCYVYVDTTQMKLSNDLKLEDLLLFFLMMVNLFQQIDEK